MAKSPQGGFELPNELRSMAENSMAQARQAFDGFMGAAQNAVQKMEERATAAQTGAKAANERIMTFAQQNIASSFDYAERLVRAQSISEIMQIHAEFAKQQMQALGEQSKALSQAATEAASGGKKKT
jgi:phasin